MDSIYISFAIQVFVCFICVRAADEQFSVRIDERTKLDEVVREFGTENESITIADLKTLDPNIRWGEEEILREYQKLFIVGWLTDKIIDYYLYVTCGNHPYETLCIWSVSGALLPAHYVDDESIFHFRAFADARYRKMIVPCNPTENHWLLFVAVKSSTTLYILDPAHENPLFIHRIRRAVENFEQILFAVTGLKFKYRLPRRTIQSNNRDCGIFVCYYAYRVLHGGKLTEPFDELDLRKKIYKSILSH